MCLQSLYLVHIVFYSKSTLYILQRLYLVQILFENVSTEPVLSTHCFLLEKYSLDLTAPLPSTNTF
jgi:hypothetical protein